VVGAGPAGAAAAIRLARAGVNVRLLEREPAPRWRACGVYTSPATVSALRRLGLADDVIAPLARPVPGLRVESRRGATFRLAYAESDGTGSGRGDRACAVGLARPAFDALLIEMAQAAGADVRRGARVVGVRQEAAGRWRLELADGGTVAADLVVGADGPRSTIARTMGVEAHAPIRRRIGLTFHIDDPAGERIHDARIVVLPDGYVGLAPVPGARLNVGIVLWGAWLERVRRESPAAVAIEILRRPEVIELAAAGHDPPAILDHVAGSAPLGHAVRRRGGHGWLLIGDAAGFLDPFTGEGLHRSLASAELAAAAILADGPAAGPRHDAAMRRGFGQRDLVTRIVDAFLARPPLFEYAARRLARREAARRTIGLVIGDLISPGRALEPRFLAGLLRP